MSGRLIAVVGPSGVGKDSLIAGLAQARPALHVVRRVISRPPEMGGEAFDGVSESEFLRRAASGAFCLSWQAHGLRYGIPAETLNIGPRGQDAVVNLSRTVLDEAVRLFENLIVLRITARPETLALRLAHRGRESAEDIKRRLARPEPRLPGGLTIIEVSNDGSIQEAVHRALGALYPARV